LCSVETENAKEKEHLIHEILTLRGLWPKTYRIRQDREFFRDLCENMIKSLFKLASFGNIQIPTLRIENVLPIETPKPSPRSEIVLENYLKDGQPIRHKIGDDYLEGIFDLKTKRIVCTSGKFSSITDFVRAHEDMRKAKKKGSSPHLRRECEIFTNGKWIPIEK
jgi:hypothetical protein